MRALECRHCYHAQCVDDWFEATSNYTVRCPLRCNLAAATDPNAAAAAVAADVQIEATSFMSGFLAIDAASTALILHYMLDVLTKSRTEAKSSNFLQFFRDFGILALTLVPDRSYEIGSGLTLQSTGADMANRGNTEAAAFLMNEKMKGKRLLGSLEKPLSAYPVTQKPDDDEESFVEEATVVPAAEGEAQQDAVNYFYRVGGDDYEHTLALESHEDEEEDNGFPDGEDEQTNFEGIPDDDTQPEDVQTLLAAEDDQTVFPQEDDQISEDDQTFFEDDADDAVWQCDELQAGGDGTQDGLNVPIGAFKKRRTG
eukprot:s3256_g9.t1